MRVRFLEGTQSSFLNKVKDSCGISWPEIACVCKVHRRTLFDWRRDKYQMGAAALQLLKRRYEIIVPKMEVLPDTWHLKDAARLGAIRHNELYGNPGTFEGRKKGGTVSALKFKNDPEYAKRLGFILRKQVIHPRKSALLAEFLGIVLGDGSITTSQVRIYVNSKTDRDYAYFIKKTVASLFNINATITGKSKNCFDIVISSRNLVDFLVDCGLKKGDKILSGVDVPEWILKDREFSKSCLRGLMDTDGGIFFHNHVTKGIRYRHMGICFTSHSKLILNSAYKTMRNFSINCKTDGKRHVMIYNRDEVEKYMDVIGSHNYKHIKRFKSYRGPKFLN